jgi:cytochrome c1
MKRSLGILLLVPALFLLMAAFAGFTAAIDAKSAPLRTDADENAKRLIEQGRQIFRFDTFGDEAFWTDQLEMQQSVNVSGATLIPNAHGLAGHNLHTWTGGWGTVPYWNAFVAVNELHGKGTFFDERFDDPVQFPIAAAARLGHVSVDPDSDQVTAKLPALHLYQLALPSLQPRAGVDFDQAAATRGDQLFSGKANCNSCHHEPLWSEPGWNQHTADEMKIDNFEAERAPGHAYQTVNLAGLFVRERCLFMFQENKGRFYHDGRFQTLLDVVNSYDTRFNLGLTDQEKYDLVEYLKSL